MLVLLRSFYYAPDASFILEFFTCTPNASFRACFLMTLMLVLVRLVRNFSITPGVCFIEGFLLRTSC